MGKKIWILSSFRGWIPVTCGNLHSRCLLGTIQATVAFVVIILFLMISISEIFSSHRELKSSMFGELKTKFPASEYFHRKAGWVYIFEFLIRLNQSRWDPNHNTVSDVRTCMLDSLLSGLNSASTRRWMDKQNMTNFWRYTGANNQILVNYSSTLATYILIRPTVGEGGVRVQTPFSGFKTRNRTHFSAVKGSWILKIATASLTFSSKYPIKSWIRQWILCCI